MRTPTPIVLVTGFGPFPGMPVNASAHLVARLAKAAPQRLPAAAVVTAVLPTEWQAAPVMLATLIARHAPAIALHFGVSQHVEGFAIERHALNACRLAPDAAGCLPAADVLHAEGPARRETRLPVAAIVTRLAALRLPVSVSDDAGAYLCNSVLYHSLAHAERNAVAVSGFVHIPAGLGKIGGPLGWDLAIDGALEIVAACVDAAGSAPRKGPVIRRGAGPLRSTGRF